MVGSGHPAHDTRAARPDLARDAMGNAARSRAGSPTRVCPLVSKARAHLQRCPGPCPPRTLDLADFRRLTGSPRRAETLSRRDQPPLARRLPTALTYKAKLRVLRERGERVDEPGPVLASLAHAHDAAAADVD